MPFQFTRSLPHIAMIATLTALAACKPPASDDYLQRSYSAAEREAPSAPIASPDTEGAIWAPGAQGRRLIYGKPGTAPLMALECESGMISYTRFALADPRAQAVLALIGNGHVQRLWIDAEQSGEAWLWRGSLPADDERLEVLTGPHAVEATVPGAGTLMLNPSRLPGELIRRCRDGEEESTTPTTDAAISGPENAPSLPADPA